MHSAGVVVKIPGRFKQDVRRLKQAIEARSKDPRDAKAMSNEK